jgi:hypothetical protein
MLVAVKASDQTIVIVKLSRYAMLAPEVREVYNSCSFLTLALVEG